MDNFKRKSRQTNNAKLQSNNNKPYKKPKPNLLTQINKTTFENSTKLSRNTSRSSINVFSKRLLCREEKRKNLMISREDKNVKASILQKNSSTSDQSKSKSDYNSKKYFSSRNTSKNAKCLKKKRNGKRRTNNTDYIPNINNGNKSSNCVVVNNNCKANKDKDESNNNSNSYKNSELTSTIESYYNGVNCEVFLASIRLKNTKPNISLSDYFNTISKETIIYSNAKDDKLELVFFLIENLEFDDINNNSYLTNNEVFCQIKSSKKANFSVKIKSFYENNPSNLVYSGYKEFTNTDNIQHSFILNNDAKVKENDEYSLDDLIILVEINCKDISSAIFDETEFVGIVNSGNTCYMNCLIQVLNNISRFKQTILNTDLNNTSILVKDSTDELNIKNSTCFNTPSSIHSKHSPIVSEFQTLFYNLSTSKIPLSTETLTKAFGWNTTHSLFQQDVHEFNLLLSEVLGKPYLMFQGKIENTISCINVNYESKREEKFIDLSLTVKNMNNLYDSLDEYIKPENLVGENKYDAEGFGKQDAKKYCLFKELPDVLFLQLNRIEYCLEKRELSKINSAFEYYDEIDLDKYTTDFKERNNNKNMKISNENKDNNVENVCNNNTYSLFSVIVHSGSANGGHYYCYIKFNDSWILFNDELIKKASNYEVFDFNFSNDKQVLKFNDKGRITKNNITNDSSAYLLVYVRKSELTNLIFPFKLETLSNNTLVNLEKKQKLEFSKININNVLSDYTDILFINYSLFYEYKGKGLPFFEGMFSSLNELVFNDECFFIKLSGELSILELREMIFAVIKKSNIDKLSNKILNSDNKLDVRNGKKFSFSEVIANDDLANTKINICIDDIELFYLDITSNDSSLSNNYNYINLTFEDSNDVNDLKETSYINYSVNELKSLLKPRLMTILYRIKMRDLNLKEELLKTTTTPYTYSNNSKFITKLTSNHFAFFYSNYTALYNRKENNNTDNKIKNMEVKRIINNKIVIIKEVINNELVIKEILITNLDSILELINSNNDSDLSANCLFYIEEEQNLIQLNNYNTNLIINKYLSDKKKDHQNTNNAIIKISILILIKANNIRTNEQSQPYKVTTQIIPLIRHVKLDIFIKQFNCYFMNVIFKIKTNNNNITDETDDFNNKAIKDTIYSVIRSDKTIQAINTEIDYVLNKKQELILLRDFIEQNTSHSNMRFVNEKEENISLSDLDISIKLNKILSVNIKYEDSSIRSRLGSFCNTNNYNMSNNDNVTVDADSPFNSDKKYNDIIIDLSVNNYNSLNSNTTIKAISNRVLFFYPNYIKSFKSLKEYILNAMKNSKTAIIKDYNTEDKLFFVIYNPQSNYIYNIIENEDLLIFQALSLTNNEYRIKLATISKVEDILSISCNNSIANYSNDHSNNHNNHLNSANKISYHKIAKSINYLNDIILFKFRNNNLEKLFVSLMIKVKSNIYSINTKKNHLIIESTSYETKPHISSYAGDVHIENNNSKINNYQSKLFLINSITNKFPLVLYITNNTTKKELSYIIKKLLLLDSDFKAFLLSNNNDDINVSAELIRSLNDGWFINKQISINFFVGYVKKYCLEKHLNLQNYSEETSLAEIWNEGFKEARVKNLVVEIII